MKSHISRTVGATLIALVAPMCTPALAQQFNSDSWLSKPHGVVTIIPTIGERNSMLMTTFSLFPRWEFTLAGFFYNDDGDPATNDGYSNTLYAKYMFWENETKNGGMAVKFGTGMFPGFLADDTREKDAFRTYWVNCPLTLPFLGDRLSWDLMPGVSWTDPHAATGEPGWDFTYSTRLAWYAFNPRTAIVGEVYGSEGNGGSGPNYRAGLRWEPNPHVAWAFTYGEASGDDRGPGFEIGVMLFSPPFACVGPCK
jgi:hypothetical protein